MTKSYVYQVLKDDKFKVVRLDDKKEKGERLEEYIVNLKNGATMCSCPGFYYKKKACRHIKFILEQLKEGGGILSYNEDYDKLIESVKKQS